MSSSQTVRLLNDAMTRNQETLLETILLKQKAAADVKTPPAGSLVLFVDTDGALKTKNPAGTVQTVTVS